MENFIFQNTAKMIFGKGTIAQIAQEIPSDKKVMVIYGGGSIKKNGVFDQVEAALSNYKVCYFPGIESNPTVQTLRKAIAYGKEQGAEFLLGVGGGSVSDATKVIAMGILSDRDAWDLVIKSTPNPKTLPFGIVMTMPATGSEMNAGSVISNTDTKEKFAVYSHVPNFAILDPEVTYSIPAYQVSCGIADTFVHVMEQYLTFPGQNLVMDRFAEGILLTLIEIAPYVNEEPRDYDVMSHYMYCASMALNGLLKMGVKTDWVTHQIGHELTALHGLTHAESLTVVLPGTLTVLAQQKKGKLLQYAERVWGIDCEDTTQAMANAIAQTANFFKNLGLKTHLSELNIGEETIAEIEKRFNDRGVHLGEQGNVTGEVARAILEASL